VADRSMAGVLHDAREAEKHCKRQTVRPKDRVDEFGRTTEELRLAAPAADLRHLAVDDVAPGVRHDWSPPPPDPSNAARRMSKAILHCKKSMHF
jgi:hypothetical protein